MEPFPESNASIPPCFIPFSRPIEKAELPLRFNYPFFHEPHPLCILAAGELQQYLQQQQEWEHNFGLNPSQKGLIIGKMFGVMLVQNTNGDIGYLTAFSGKLANRNSHPRFVPPVFDMLQPDGFFLKGEQELNALNAQIVQIEQASERLVAEAALDDIQQQARQELNAQKEKIRVNKQRRQDQREHAAFSLCAEGHLAVLESLKQESIREQGELKFLQRHWKKATEAALTHLDTFRAAVQKLKTERKTKSAELQEQLFAQYNFLNKDGVFKNLKSIFAASHPDNPPSGAGECAAPKMLQYAFRHQLKPLAFAEFWWGQSPVSEIRKHGHFYPACRGKCEPILAHMLSGVKIDPNPMLQQQDLGCQLKTVYEDEHIVVLNKPAELLSVPGKIAAPSVLSILQQRYPDATGPLLVHRLDMATSGLLIAAKSKEGYQYLQSQFIKKTVKKTYIALLEGMLTTSQGRIELPLRVDLDNRPHQLVCYEYGKPAITEWTKISEMNGRTWVKLFPLTGRTHQLRVHCAHQAGLNIPIVGDDLYGKKEHRLHLHAHSLSIKHPATRQEMTFISEPPF